MTTPVRKILLTGHRGYIGSVMVPHLLAYGYEVVGLDVGYFDDCTLVDAPGLAPVVRKDIRDLSPRDLAGADAIIHLAALSNDPIGNLDETWTQEINQRGSVRLAEIAKAGGVHRFLFSSSCIMYGLSTSEFCDEDSPLAPQTAYARSKVASEAAISELADDNFSPVFLRNGTIYGLSPRMRFDTVMNDLVGAAFTTGKVTVLSDGTPWRPVIHIDDVARSFQAVLEAPEEDIHDQAFNNGADHLNYQIRELADIAASVVPGCEREILGTPTADQRTYRAQFSKFSRTFPTFEFRHTALTGAQQLAAEFEKIGLTREQFTSAHFTRLAWLQHLMETGELDGSLRWTTPVGALA